MPRHGGQRMSDELEGHTPEEIAHGTTDYLMYLEECDGEECVYSWHRLMEGSVLLYEFRDKGGGDTRRGKAVKDNG